MSRVRETPERPDMPVDGLSIEDWAMRWGEKLGDYFVAKENRSPDVVEWTDFLEKQYQFQTLKDETP